MSKLNIFVPITKVDAAKGLVYGVLAKQEKDHSGEIFDYAGSKPYFEKWSAGIAKATDGKSMGNLRAMHSSVAAGKFTSIKFNDDEQQIEVCAKVVDKAELEKVLEGVYTGFSIGGKYVSRKKDGDAMKYIADPYEGSLVDLPCMPSATFDIIKADGVTLQKKFEPVGEVEAKARELAKAAGAKDDAEVDAQWQAFEGDAIEALTKIADAPVVEKPPVVEAPKEPSNDEIAAKARELAKAAGKDDGWIAFIEPAVAALKAAPIVKADVAPPVVKVVTPPAADAPGPGATESDDGTEAQVWVHKRLAGKTFGKKAEMRAALVQLDADEAAAKLSKGVTDQLADITGVLDAHEQSPVHKAAFDAYAAKATADLDTALQKASGLTPQEWADAGAFAGDRPAHAAVKALAKVDVILNADGTMKEMPEPTKVALKALLAAAKDPDAEVDDVEVEITDKASLQAALKGFDPDKPVGFLTRRKIVKAAHEFDCVADLPAGWIAKDEPVDLKKIAEGDLKKSASLYSIGSLIQLLAQVDSCEESLECPGYGYGTMVPKALCDRFGSVLVEMGDIVAEVLDVVLAEMREEEASEAAGSVMRIAKALANFSGAIIDAPLVKAGARHSRADVNMINEVHTLAVGLGAECGDDDEDAAKATVSTLKKAMLANEAAFAKTMGEVSSVLKDVAERVKRIEAQPLPEGTTSYRVVEKGLEPQIVGPGGDGDQSEVLRANAEIFASLSNLIVRNAHQNPHHDVPGYMRRRF